MGRTEIPQAVTRFVIQPLPKPVGEIFFLKYKHDSNEKSNDKKTPIRIYSRYDILLGKEGRLIPQKPKPPEGTILHE
jgi:hypothetical protein